MPILLIHMREEKRTKKSIFVHSVGCTNFDFFDRNGPGLATVLEVIGCRWSTAEACLPNSSQCRENLKNVLIFHKVFFKGQHVEWLLGSEMVV